MSILFYENATCNYICSSPGFRPGLRFGPQKSFTESLITADFTATGCYSGARTAHVIIFMFLGTGKLPGNAACGLFGFGTGYVLATTKRMREIA